MVLPPPPFPNNRQTAFQDVLTNIKSILPAEAANALTELIPDPPNKVPQTGPVVPVDEHDISAVATSTATTAAAAPPPLPPAAPPAAGAWLSALVRCCERRRRAASARRSATPPCFALR